MHPDCGVLLALGVPTSLLETRLRQSRPEWHGQKIEARLGEMTRMVAAFATSGKWNHKLP